MQGLSWRERTGARLRWWQRQLYQAWCRRTGRCYGCGHRRDRHKFGCSYRPGRGERLSMREL
jgi:hypothetical protein